MKNGAPSMFAVVSGSPGLAALALVLASASLPACAGSKGSGASDTGGSSSSASSSSSSGAGDAEPPVMMGMTAAHNEARAAVMPVATPALPTMEWSSTIAASAQTFVENCVFADTMGPYGSNAFAGTGTYTPAQVVAAWVGEDANYDYATNSCTPNQQCGHYTQVVWRDSVKLGCGTKTCTTNSPFGGSAPWELWVCNYDPPGNYIGMKPY
jgi:uncharacterized protein YkwD